MHTAPYFVRIAFGISLSAFCAMIAGCPPQMPIDDNTNQNANDNSGDNTNANANANANGNSNSNGNANGNDDGRPADGDKIDGPPTEDPLPARSAAAAPTAPAPDPVLGATALLNEVLFDPAEGGVAFVELKVPAGGAALGGLRIKNEKNATIEIAAGTPANAAGLLLVVFDGADSAEAGIVHVAEADFLSPRAGELTLMSAAGAELDRIAWGTGSGSAVPLNRGGGSDPDDAPKGTSIGRFPRSVDPGRFQWTSFPPLWVTPGKPNHHPGVSILLPLSGFGMAAAEVRLSWYPDLSAADFRVQVARDSGFEDIVVDAIVEDGSYSPPRLQEGAYFWRVISRDADGFEATPSPANVLFVHDEVSTDEVGDDGTAKSLRSQPAAGTVFRRNLDSRSPGGIFPTTSQRKDTFLLTMQSPRTDAGHGWDEPHVGLDWADPADNTNCTFASTVMINNFYGGTLSQDRLTYEMRHRDATGPETDLNYGRGMWPDMPLSWALGNAALNRITTAAHNEATLWQLFVDEIDAGRPMLIVIDNLGGGTHSIVVHGYEIDARGPALRFSLIVNDPWNIGNAVAVRGPLEIHGVFNRLVFAYRVPPGALAARMEEPTVSMDTDNDGVYDFDESMRFNTDVGHIDTDRDCLDDKLEIRRSVLDPDHGVAMLLNGLGGDGGARLGSPPETTIDTDGGGLPDFVEDFDWNGRRDPGESDPYDARDDRRTITGTYEEYKLWRPYAGALNEIRARGEVMLQINDDGMITGTIAAVHTDVRSAMLTNDDENCPQPRMYRITMDEVQHTAQVRGRFVCTGSAEPRIRLVLEPADPSAPGTRTNIPVTVEDQCYGNSRGSNDRITLLTGFITSEGTVALNGGQIVFHFEPPNADVPTEVVNTLRRRWNLTVSAAAP